MLIDEDADSDFMEDGLESCEECLDGEVNFKEIECIIPEPSIQFSQVKLSQNEESQMHIIDQSKKSEVVPALLPKPAEPVEDSDLIAV